MSECQKCGFCFRDKYTLNRHLSRKTPCVIITQPVINPIQTNINQNKSNITPTQTNIKPPIDENTCKYCLHTFFNKYKKNKHLEICKSKDDPVRLLEIENNIQPKIPESKTECRFCNNSFFNNQSLGRHLITCKERENYHQKLLKKSENKSNDTPIINNITNINNINNGTINNNITYVYNFSKESVHHITIKELENLVFKFKNQIKGISDPNELKLKNGEFLIEFNNLMKKDPNNKTAWITNLKADYGKLIVDGKVETVLFPDFVEKFLINTTAKLEECHGMYGETCNVNKIDADEETSSFLYDTFEYKDGKKHYETLSKKQMKQLNDNIRISVVK